MNKPALIEKLNQAISLELGALLQYNQYHHVLLGMERKVWENFFHEQSEESFSHARLFASKVVALGGTPSCEPDAVKQTADLREMLMNSLDVERRAVRIYTEALALAEDHAGYRNLLEDQIQTETEDVEELEKFLNLVQKADQAGGNQRGSKSA